MALLARFIVLVPLVFSIASAVLAALALFAGHEKGFMEDYAIARLNISRLGYNLVDFGNDEESNENTEEDDGDDSFFDDITDGAEDAWDDVQDSIEDELNELGNEAAEEMAEALGLNEWYSLHVMAACQGLYEPNPTASSTSLNISYCNSTAPEDTFNIEEMISMELEFGPVDITLEDLNWPSEIQDNLDKINDALLALFVLYVLGIGFSGIGVFTAALSFFFPTKRTLILINAAVIGVAMLVLVIGSIIVTVAVTEGVDQINDVGEDVGVEVTRGNNFLAITWAAAGLTLVSFVIWCVQLCCVWRERKRTKMVRHSKSSI